MLIFNALHEIAMCDFRSVDSPITCRKGVACCIFVLSKRKPVFAGAHTNNFSYVHEQNFLCVA